MIEELTTKLSEHTEKIVRSGNEIRKHVATATSDAASHLHQTKDGLLGIASAVKQGAIRGIEGAHPDQAESNLRQVIDGLADGFGTAAEAINLTLQESLSSGKQFAREDLLKTRDELKQLSSAFADTVGEFAGAMKSATQQQFHSIGEHASAASRQVVPVLEETLSAVIKNAGDVAGEAGHAGLGGMKAGAGALFQALGTRISKLGDRLNSSETE